MVQFGSPELFEKDHLIRFQQLEYANNRFHQILSNKRNQVKDKVDEFTTLFVKGYGNDPELISCIRELFFNSRELLDSLLFYINKSTENQTNKSFIPFFKTLMKGDYDKIDLTILSFLKDNFTYVFHIRKFRNEIKNKISNAEFILVTDKIIAKFKLPIKQDERDLIEFLEIPKKEEALSKGLYHCQLNLNIYFPEIIDFWRLVFNNMK